MIRVDQNEDFPLAATIINESGDAVSGETVYYDIRDENDDPLVPVVSGTFDESTTGSGVYKKVVSLEESGTFYAYALCSGYNTGVEEIVVNDENIYQLTKQNRNYNIAVEDVIRENVSPTASQAARNVPMDRTDYIVTRIKEDSAGTWNDATVSGISYAWYRTITDTMPYKMAGQY
jgi:hypothetical protein